MREGCFDCMFKHLGQAAVWTYMSESFSKVPALRALEHLSKAAILQAEVVLGYPEHCGLFVGHLACASDELIGWNPEIAMEIRAQRLRWSPFLYGGEIQVVDTDVLSMKIQGVEDVWANEDHWVGNDFEIIRQTRVLGHLSEAAEEGMEASPGMAAAILNQLGEWKAYMLGVDVELSKYEGLFDSLLHTMKQKGVEEFQLKEETR